MSSREINHPGDIPSTGGNGSFAGGGERPTRGPVVPPDIASPIIPPIRPAEPICW